MFGKFIKAADEILDETAPVEEVVYDRPVNEFVDTIKSIKSMSPNQKAQKIKEEVLKVKSDNSKYKNLSTDNVRTIRTEYSKFNEETSTYLKSKNEQADRLVKQIADLQSELGNLEVKYNKEFETSYESFLSTLQDKLSSAMESESN